MNERRRWVLAPFAVISAFLIVGISTDIVTGALGYWDVVGAGFFAAIAVVVSAYFAAPNRKLLSAGIAFVLGAVCAWRMLEPSFYPVNYGVDAYQATHLPILMTYLGGVLGLALAAFLHSRTPRTPPADRRARR